MSDASERDDGDVRAAFLDEYSRDLERGGIRELVHYQSLFPGFESAIAEEFECLEDEGTLIGDAVGPSASSPEGERLGGYRILEELGRGGQAVVYLARDEELGREVALKVLTTHAGLGADSAEFLRFRREAESAARLDHPGICTVYEAGEADGLAYIAMRYVRGETLARKLSDCRQRGNLDAAPGPGMLTLSDHRTPITRATTATDNEVHTVLLLIERCARALHEAHEQGLVHRDVKPGNIMVPEDGQPVLLDFGIASIESSDHALTGSGVQIGTPYYMAPEQVRGTAVDRRTDVYALAVTLYECLTLRRPFEAPSREALYQEILAARPVPARRHNPRIAADLQVALEAAMDMDPHRRYQTALAFAEDLERLRNFESIEARPIGMWLRARRWTQRHPVRAAVTSVASVALLVAMFLWYRAEDALADWGRLADLRRVQDLTRTADEDLWPVDYRNSDTMRRWLREAEFVLLRRGLHERRLESLRGAALPYSAADHARDRERRAAGQQLRRLEGATKALTEHIDEIRSAQPDHQSLATLQERHEALAAELATAQQKFEVDHRWHFADADRQWQHDVLTDLLNRLDQLQVLRSDVEQRLKLAAELRERSMRGTADATWRATIASISSSDLYGGLSIQPQNGLLPLRVDPESGLWEFTHLPSGDPPELDDEGRYVLAVRTGVVLVLVPAGSFSMGTAKGSLNGVPGTRAWAVESPAHDVSLDAFFLSKYEVTQAQWRRVAGENPSVYQAPQAPKGKPIDDLHPVENIRKGEAREMLRRMGLLLPTEAQWEYAARAGGNSAWWSGDHPSFLEGAGNIADRQFGNRPFEEWLDDGYACHAPCGSYRANAFGLHDVAGNVWEWCLDDYGQYGTSPRPGDGLRPAWELRKGVRRGGSWMSMANEVRSARRLFADFSFHNGTIGVRPARSLDRTGR